jgi:hypothetical protein
VGDGRRRNQAVGDAGLAGRKQQSKEAVVNRWMDE